MERPNIVGLKADYRKLEVRRDETTDSIKTQETQLKSIRECETKLEKNESLSPALLDSLGLHNKTGLALRYSIKGLLKQTETSLSERRAELQRIVREMESMTVCPTCQGLGFIHEKKQYERMQEGMIIPVSTSKTCEICHGTGKLSLGIAK